MLWMLWRNCSRRAPVSPLPSQRGDAEWGAASFLQLQEDCQFFNDKRIEMEEVSGSCINKVLRLRGGDGGAERPVRRRKKRHPGKTSQPSEELRVL
jgi:hypothetical protein